MSGELYDLACSVPWCCTSDALEAMLSIAARAPLPEDEIARRLHGPKSLALRHGQRRDDSRQMTMLGSVARIPIDGPIYRYADMFTAVSGGITTEALARDLQGALDDPAVSAVLLAIDSPGGEATGINELADVIYAARGVKPIAAYIEGYGASAAYWIASAADLVAVDDSALVGSIGTILGVPDPSKRPSSRIDIVSTQSPKKKPNVLTTEGRAVIQQIADDMTEVFIAKVMRNRALAREQVLAIEGGMLVGQQAVDAGLADMLGSEEGMLRILAQHDMAGILLPARGSGAPSRQSSMIAQAATKEKRPMAKGFWAWMGGADETPATAPPALASEQIAPVMAAAPAAHTAESDQQAQIMADNTALRAQLTKMRAEQIGRDAQAFATAQITAGHALPAEQAAIVALYARAAEIDMSTARADGQPGTVALLTAAYEARPANRMASSLLPSALPAGAAVLTNAGGEGDLLHEAEQSARAYAQKANGRGAR